MSDRPLCIDLFCGLGGWTEGFLAEGYQVIGFDIEARPYPGELVLQDVLTIHGSQFRNAAAIVASPPCQEFSYRAMPWKRGKAQPPKLDQIPAWWGKPQSMMTPAELSEWKAYQLEHPLPYADVSLFDACFRIQREASEFAGHRIPMVVENVKGAQPWVGPARAHFGSFYLWGDIDSVGGSIVAGGVRFGNVLRPSKRKKGKNNFHFYEQTGLPSPSFHGADHEPSVQRAEAIKNSGGSWFNIAHNTESGHGQNPDGRKVPVYSDPRRNGGKGAHLKNPRENIERLDGTKVTGDWFGRYADMKKYGTISPGRLHGKGSKKRAEASAEIAMIPPALARHIAASFKPR